MSDESNEADDTEEQDAIIDEEASTDSASKRHWLTNDAMAWFTIVSYPGVMASGALELLDLQAVPSIMLNTYVLAFGVAIAWTFGKDAVEAWRGDKE